MKPAAAGGHMTADHQWTAPAAKPSQEESYPFGIQNDLGAVAVPGAKVSRDGSDSHSPLRSTWSHSPVCLYQSATNLAVPGNGVSMHQSVSFQSLHSTSIQYSRASSINDLSFEADQLERSIRQNDANAVKRLLEIHHGKFNVNLHGSLLDKSSCDTHSQCISQEVEILLRKSQTLIDRLGRQESVSTEPEEAPPIFANALHFAVEQEALDVVRMLLKYGVEPNAGGTGVVGHPDGAQRGSFYSLVSSSGASDDGAGTATATTTGATGGAGAARKASLQLLAPRYAKLMANDSVESSGPSSGASPVRPTSGVPSSSGGGPLLRCELLPAEKRTVRHDTEGRSVGYAEEYGREWLYTLPALFLAVAQRSGEAVYLLAKYGADVDTRDANGCTPLHLAACQDTVSWACAATLLEHGARVMTANKEGFSPQDLCPEMRRVQESLVDDVLNDLYLQVLAGAGSGGSGGGIGAAAAADGMTVPGSGSGELDGCGGLVSGSGSGTASGGLLAKHGGTAGLFRRLHSEVRNNLKAASAASGGKKQPLHQHQLLYGNQEETSCASLEPCSLSHHGSVRSRRSAFSSYEDRDVDKLFQLKT